MNVSLGLLHNSLTQANAYLLKLQPPPARQPQLQFWFKLQAMVHRNGVVQRYEDGSWRPDRYEIGEWLPPRPYRYNIRDPNDPQGSWYWFNQAQVTWQRNQPEGDNITHYKTFSFYVNNSRIWIYPCDALKYQVGDGQQNPSPMSELMVTESSSEDDEKDDDGLEAVNASSEDWTELAFNRVTRQADAIASFATKRGDSDTLHVHRPHQIWPSEVLPARYRLPQAQAVDSRTHEGMMAEIPIKIALVAFSVRPAGVRNALENSFQNTYVSSGQTPGRGCKCVTRIR